MLAPSTSLLALSAIALLAAPSAHAALACNSYSTRYGKTLNGVCVCNSTTCDSIPLDYKTLPGLGIDRIAIFRTSKSGDRMAYSTQALDATPASKIDFLVEPTVQYQTMLGFGGAFTDAAAINIYKLTPALQQQVLDAYYGEHGLEYSVGRIPIASCDFSESVYSYNPVVDDLEMQHFSIDVDRAPQSHKLELIKRALKTATRELSIFASSWAPPTWMLRANSTLDAQVKGSPGEPYWKALALYYAKFIEAYEKEGISIWGMTVQNEPVKPVLQLKRWQSLRLTPEEERDFIKKDLGPLLKTRFPNLKLLAHDDQKPDLLDRSAVYKDADAMKYIDGVGVHWYKNLDFFFFGLGGDFDKLKTFHDAHPDKFILATEACAGSMPEALGTGAGTKLGNLDKMWARAENYANDITNDVGNWAVGWTDWNLVLDTAGGPNWAGNMVDAPILVDEKSGIEFYKQPMYYVLGHFAKFVPKGSIHVHLHSKSSKNWNYIDYVAFLTPDQHIVAVFHNRRDSAATVVLQTPTLKTVSVALPSRSIQTILLA